MSVSLHNNATAGADPGQISPALTEAVATRSAGGMNELRSRSGGSAPDRIDRGDVVKFSSVGQKKVVLASNRPDAPPLDRPKGEQTRVSESQMRPSETVFQTLTAKVRFVKSENGEIVVQIVDSRTQEVVRQLPSGGFLKLQGRIEQMASELAAEKEKGFLLETAV